MWLYSGISVGATKESENSQNQKYYVTTISIHLPFAGGLRNVVGNKDGGNDMGQVHANPKSANPDTRSTRAYKHPTRSSTTTHQTSDVNQT